MATSNSNKKAEIAKWREWKKTKEGREFPLTVNGNGQWSRKARGRVYFFGILSDQEAARAEWLRCRDDILAGRGKPPKDNGELTVAKGCNRFLHSRRQRLEDGELSRGMWHEYECVCTKIVEHFGRHRPISRIEPTDFAAFKRRLMKTRSGRGLSNMIVLTRTVFKWLYSMGLIESPMRYGDDFGVPTKAAIRRRKSKEGAKSFDREEILTILDGTATMGKPVRKEWRAMVLLGVNGGLGCADLSHIEFRHLDLDAAILDFPRVKNGATRVVSLWPETVSAIREYLDERPEPREGLEEIVFLNSKGNYWTRGGDANSSRYSGADRQFRALLKRLELHQPGNSFYGLRRSYRTAVDDHPDRHAIRLTMGHVGADIGESVYVQYIENGRLRSVAEHARQWLFYAPCEKCEEPVHAWHKVEHVCPEEADAAGEVTVHGFSRVEAMELDAVADGR